MIINCISFKGNICRKRIIENTEQIITKKRTIIQNNKPLAATYTYILDNTKRNLNLTNSGLVDNRISNYFKVKNYHKIIKNKYAK